MNYYRIKFENDQVRIIGKSGWIPLKKGNHLLSEKGLWLRKKNLFIHKFPRSRTDVEWGKNNYYPIESFEMNRAMIRAP